MIGACSINKVILMGRLTRDPEMRQSSNGTMSCRFTVAIDRNLSPAAAQSGVERQTDFISVVAFDRQAEFVTRYLSKGKLAIIEGSLRTGSYDDRNHPDVKHFTTDVWADRISFGETKSSSGGQGGYQQGGYNNNYNQQGNYNNAQNQQPAYQQSAPAPSVSVGDLSDFEEVISDSDLPF